MGLGPESLLNHVADFSITSAFWVSRKIAISSTTTRVRCAANRRTPKLPPPWLTPSSSTGRRGAETRSAFGTPISKYYRLGNMGSLIGDYYQMALAIPCPFLITMGAILLDYESASK